MRILIAEDDPVTSRRLQGLAEAWGYEVSVTTEGRWTLGGLEGGEGPRLVLLDWVMPGMAGVQICDALRHRTGGDEIYIIMLTARHTREDMMAGFEAGVDDFLVKP